MTFDFVGYMRIDGLGPNLNSLPKLFGLAIKMKDLRHGSATPDHDVYRAAHARNPTGRLHAT